MAEAQGRSQAELIRDALKAYAKRARRPLPAGLGKYDSGETDVSDRAEDILLEAAKRRLNGSTSRRYHRALRAKRYSLLHH